MNGDKAHESLINIKSQRETIRERQNKNIMVHHFTLRIKLEIKRLRMPNIGKGRGAAGTHGTTTSENCSIAS